MNINWGNQSLIDTLEMELPESTFYWLLISIAAAIVWIVYLTYYNSRILGLILTTILNRFIKYGHVKFGSFSFSVLSGKVMFRDVHYITEDFSVRVQLGLAIFRWWRPLILKEINEDLSHSETRLSVYLDTFELHVYNRSENFARLEKLFGLDEFTIPKKDEDSQDKDGAARTVTATVTQSQEGRWQWRDLIPVIKIDISAGKMVFGNYQLPTTLSINCGDAHIVYTTKPASTPFDQFMHIVKCRVDNIRVMLVPSPKYIGPVDEPPRFMGEGFVVLQSNMVDIYHYHDEAGFVPFEPELVQLANGDVIARRTWPCWGADVKSGKATDLSYGPWADRQREFLWKFFYPADYQKIEITVLPEPGQRRIFKEFDFKMSLQADATFDILFTKNKETQAIHMNTKAGSYLEFTTPWITEEAGYVSKVNGQLMHLDASTSLQFRSLLECETLEFDIDINYPNNWNDHQDWKCDFTACKASLYIVFAHKIFFQDLMEDWASKARPELFHFVPYTWRFSILMKQFELMLLANEYNWIDCFGQVPENSQIAFCGETFDLTLNLPFIDFLPQTVPIKLFIRGESVDCRTYLPETNTSRHILMSLANNMKVMGRDGTVLDVPFSTHQAEKKWRRATQKSLGWVDCWTTPIVALSIGYTYHPIPPCSSDAHRAHTDPISTPDAEEQLLIPLRLVPLRPLRPKKSKTTGLGLEEFDPTVLDPDIISVELEVGPSMLILYGSLLRNFLHVKENYFGEDQVFTDYEDSNPDQLSTFTHVSAAVDEGREAEEFDPCQYRPLHVKVQVTLHDVQAHLVKNCDDEGPPCPCIYLERLGFEMDKRYEETKLQVSISPAILVAKDTVQRPNGHSHLCEGHLALSGLQVRGHAMFSHQGLPLDTETLEYAWLLEVTVGDVTGRLTAPQLQNIVEFLQTFVFLVEDSENTLQRRLAYRTCQHGVPQPECTHHNPSTCFPCPTTEDIKYRMTRATVDCIDLYLVETGAALNLQVYPVRVATCNLHGKNNKAGVTVLIPNLNVKQLLLSSPVDQHYSGPADMWLEAGGVSLGPLNVDAAMALPSPEFHPIQDTFLRDHDKRTHRLWFLWPPDLSVMTPKVVGKCGCVGGCRFFGTNRNGRRFFQPNDHDFVDGINTAVFHICTEGVELGYGQSLLQKGQLIFDIQGTSLPVTPSKSKLIDKGRLLSGGSKMSVDTPCTSTTLVDDGSLRQSSLLAYITDHSSTGPDHISSSEQTLKGSDTNESSGPRESESVSGQSAGAMSVPSEMLPESPMPDPYDTDHCGSTPSDTAVTWLSGGSGSATSLPDVINQKMRKGHGRKYSYDASKVPSTTGTLPCNSSNASETVPVPISPMETPQRKDSLGSFPSYTSGQSVSRQSSLTSPVLRRLSSQFSIQNDGSQASMTGSERFFSAPEDVNEVVTTSGSEYMDAAHTLINGLTHHVTSTSSASEYRSFSDVSMGSPSSADNTLQQTVIHNALHTPAKLAHHDSTSSTESLASYVSAMSSQVGSLHDFNRMTSQPDISREQIETEIEADTAGETEGGETPTNSHNYVDLHGQINQQITKSPLLMSCYINHLTQLHCSHWSSPPPLPHLVIKPQNSGQTDVSSSFHSKISSPGVSDHAPTPAWIPHFAYRQQGFGPRLMVAKREPQSPPSLSSPSSPVDKNKTGSVFVDSTPDADLGFTYDDHVSKTTAVVDLKGSVDIMISPLLLESLQRYVEAVTPLLAGLHPSTIVDGLHLQCSTAVKAQNKLKTRSSRTEPPPTEGTGARTRADSDTAEVQDSKTSRIQIMFSLSKMNINVLQVSLVEEVISMAALDYVRDLTCVSVLAMCLGDITCQLLANHHSHKTLELLGSDTSPDSGTATKKPNGTTTKKSTGTGDAAAKKKGDVCEAEAEHTMELQREEMVGNLHIGHVHFQLRRMKKNSNFSDRVILTAIPEYRSKVLFSFHRPHNQASPQRYSTLVRGMEPRPPGPEPTPEDLAGFIMFECGLEDINLRAAKRSGFQPVLGLQEEENMAHIDLVLQTLHEKTGFPGPASHHSATHTQARDTHGTSTKPGMNANNHNGDAGRESDTGSVNGSNASGLGNSADDEASSWHSRVSFPSEVGEGGLGEASGELRGDASSCVLEFKTAWFNFAAPPPSPRKRKLEYTRLDWNLLSTFTPAINAWMNPGHRAMVASRQLIIQLKYRVCTVMACIMTEALDYQRLHLPARHKYGKIMSLAKTLQEDPSCQLLAVLQKYIRKVGLKVIEENINVDTIPQLITIQKGLLALTRQWKNVLYMPVIDTSFKNRRKMHPYTVTFAIPSDESIDDNFTNLGMEEPEITGSLDNFEVVDEKTSLLKAEGGSIGHAGSLLSLSGSGAAPPPPAPTVTQLPRPASTGQLNTTGLDLLDPTAKTISVESLPGEDHHASVNLAKGRSKGSILAAHTPYSSIDSPAKLTLGSQSVPGSTGHLPPPKIRRNESNMSFPSGSVSMSSVEVGGMSGPSTPLKTSLTRQLSELEKREDEDLYRWMQRQQEYTRLCNHPNLHYYPSIGHDSFVNAGLSEYSQDDSISMQQVAMAHSLLQLADAQHAGSKTSQSFPKHYNKEVAKLDRVAEQLLKVNKRKHSHQVWALGPIQLMVLFKPLLAAIGIHLGAVKTSAFMKKFGGNVSIQGKLQTLRIDIVDSETVTSRKNKGKAQKARLKKLPKLHIDAGLDTPAFLCDAFSVVVCMKDMVDFEKDEDGGSASGLDWRRRSLRAIKFAMDHMEAKPTTTKVHFSINCNAINQHVNMSLLRLVHQFVTMIENINETRVELSGHKADYKMHRKQDSKGSSTGTESAEHQEGMKGEGTSPLLDMETPTPNDILTSASSTGHKHDGRPQRPEVPPKRPREAPPRPEAPPRKRIEAPPRPEAPPQRAGSKMVLADTRPDRLPMSLPSTFGKSPKKFSFKRGKAELFGGGSKATSEASTKSGASDNTKTGAVNSPPLPELNLSDSAVVEMADTSSPALAEKTIVDEIKANTPKCWRTLYHLLELYSTMPETKTLGRQTSASRLSVIDEEPEKLSQTQSLPRGHAQRVGRGKLQVRPNADQAERQPVAGGGGLTPQGPTPLAPGGQYTNRVAYTGNTFTQSIFISESIPLVVFGIAKVKRIRISAMLSGLKLEADLQNVHTSATHRERVKGVLKRKSRESSATAYVGHTMIVLLEGVPPSMQTVVTVNIAKSQGLYSSVTKRSRDHNSALVMVGKIDVDIPQHPVVLHGMVARSSRRLSSTLQEFMRTPAKVSRSFDSMDGSLPSQQPSRHSELNEYMTSGHGAGAGVGPGTPGHPNKTDTSPAPMVIHFKAVLQGLVIGASLLPSLKAQYKMGEVSSSGVTGKKARFTVDLPNHSLSFSSKVNPQLDPFTPDADTSVVPSRGPTPNVVLRKRPGRRSQRDPVSTPITLPTSASVDLPPIHIHADYRQHSADTLSTDGGLTEGLVLREGNYLNAVAEVGAFEHSLTTDLLNHLVFVQKVFMKEVNEVVQKVSGTDQPVPLWTEEGFSVGKEPSKPLLYSLHFTLKGIQITATTPTSNAVRLETGCIELELSNRVQTASKDGTAVKNTAPKVFVKAQVDLNLALGTLLRNPMFEEAEPEFQHLASFATRIGLRNALQDEMIPEVSKDQEALLISLKRPVVFVQPAAFDKAVLVWLNYKNAYEYWNEQRLALNKEVQTATQQVIDKLPLGTTSAAPALGTLFLQLTVDDLGICLPMTAQGLGSGGKMIDEPGAAMVLTLESTQVSACSCGSLVSKGRFTGFSLRFADDFEVSWDDWKPDKSLDLVMNAMVVPEGTYEVCSRTSAATEAGANPSWILNVMWQMCGIDVHLDTNIGKRLSALGNTLTSLTGEQSHDDELAETEGELQTLKVEMPQGRKGSLLPEVLPAFVYDTSIDAKTRARLIEQEMNEQAKIVQDLKQLGATHATIDIEARKLAELEAAVFNDFRQDIMKKIKRQSVKATALKDKLGLGYKPAHIRSKSTGAAPLTHLRRKNSGKGRLASYREDVVGGSAGWGEKLPTSPTSPPRGGAGIGTRGQQRALSIDVDALNGQRMALMSPNKDMFSTTVDDPTHFQFEDTSPSSHGSGGGGVGSGSGATGSPPYQRLAYTDLLESSSEESDPDTVDGDLEFLGTARKINFDETQDGRAAKVPSPGVGSSGSQKTGYLLDPSVDFQLDIKVEISSGQCVLHPKERVFIKMDQLDAEPRMRGGKRDSKSDLSPNLSRKRKKHSTDSGRFHHGKMSSQQSTTDNTTVFFLPGLDVKVHYNSKTQPINTGSESPTSSMRPDFGTSFTRHTTTPTTPPNSATSPPQTPPTLIVNDTPHMSDVPNTGSGTNVKKPEKKANLYAWLYLQQLSEEMLITPVLLDFLEQALEPIPLVQLTQSKSHKTASLYASAAGGEELDTSATSLVSSTNAYSSFPVDVVVYIRVQPSLIRFSCLPVSRVECLLRLPSLDLVFSTKRGDVEGNLIPDTSPPTKAKSMAAGIKRSNSLGSRTALSGRPRTSSGTQLTVVDTLAGGGLSVTGCLADFSFYIFHPYGGGGQKKSSLSLLENSFKHRSRDHNGTYDSMQSPLADAIGRKDSLSLNVEFVKVNISRSRRGVLHGHEAPLTPSQSSSKLSSMLADAGSKAANIVRFSAVCDIGSASFKYDMRRLSEILALPKAWYRRSLARRVFLGEERATNIVSDSEDETSSSPPTPESPLFSPFGRAQTISSIPTSHLESGEKATAHRRVASEDRNVPVNLEFKKELDSINQSRTPSAPQSPSDVAPPRTPATSPTQQRARPLSPPLHDLPSRLRSYERLHGERGFGLRGDHETKSKSDSNQQLQAGKPTKEWETLVLFAVNLARLDVMVNMSNVMGQSVWATTDLKSQGRLSIDSNGYKNMKITAGLGGSKLEAQGGIVGGKIQLHNLTSYMSVSEDPGHEPDHSAGLTLFTVETRLDYMGSSMLMGRMSQLEATLSDEWRLDMNNTDTQPLATKRPAIVFVHGDLSWDKLHLMISRSTTPDLVKMAAKLEEFFYQQFHSSKRVLSAFGPIPGANRKSRSSKNSGDEASWISEIRHHRHWQQVLQRASGCKLSMFTLRLPPVGTILGGTVSLHGNNLSLACFHGINFRSKSWALFTMDEPYIGFATEAQDIVDDEGAKCTHIVENLSFQLGHNFSERNRDQHMATICKLSRSHYMPPPFTSVSEWFHYAFASSEIKNLDNFPPAPRAGSESPQERRASSRKSQDYNHETEVIFALPSLQMHLKTEHLQGEYPPTEDDPKPIVECSFVTEFEDHIFVAMDAEAILFLHDLVTNYVKEKDRGTRTASYHKRSPDAEKKPISDPTAVLKQDFREFECKTWHLEPTVRFISWAGKRIDPMGVDYILQKLGFQHARLTIPKWMQRGAMDPLDKVLSVLVHRLITVLHQAEPDADINH